MIENVLRIPQKLPVRLPAVQRGIMLAGHKPEVFDLEFARDFAELL